MSLCCFSLDGRRDKQTSPGTSMPPLSLDMGSRPTPNYHSLPVMRLSSVVLHPSSLRGFSPHSNRQLGVDKISHASIYVIPPSRSTLGPRRMLYHLTCWLWWLTAPWPPGQDRTPADSCPTSRWAASSMQCQPADCSQSTRTGSNTPMR